MSFFRLKRSALKVADSPAPAPIIKPVKLDKAPEPPKSKENEIDPATQGILSKPLPGRQRISYKTSKSIATKSGDRLPVTVSPAAQNLAAKQACNTAVCWTPEYEAQVDALSRPSEAALIARTVDEIEDDELIFDEDEEGEYDPETDEDNF